METSKIIEELDNLQEHLEDIKEENYNNVKKIILESQYLQTNDGIESLVHLLNTTARFRPFFIPLLVRLSIELTSSIPKSNLLFLKNLIPNKIGKLGDIIFYTVYFLKDILPFDQIISKITHYMSIDNVPEYASLYVWFAPEIKEHNPTLFESITQPSDDYMSPDLEYFWERKDSLFANDFALLKTLRSKGLNDAPYFHCFIEDDPTDLSDVDVETTLPISCYDRFFLLQSSPPLIHLAAYFNASKCFDYLMKKGANLKSTDSYNRTLDLYCIAGSNIEAFSRIEEPNIFKCLLIATSNHRNNMVEMLQSKQSTEDNLTVFGSMLHQSCGTHNIHMTLMCIKNGADINLANSNGETPLHYTANYGHFDLAKLLLAQKDINPNPQNNEINFCFFGV